MTNQILPTAATQTISLKSAPKLPVVSGCVRVDHVEATAGMSERFSVALYSNDPATGEPRKTALGSVWADKADRVVGLMEAAENPMAKYRVECLKKLSRNGTEILEPREFVADDSLPNLEATPNIGWSYHDVREEPGMSPMLTAALITHDEGPVTQIGTTYAPEVIADAMAIEQETPVNVQTVTGTRWDKKQGRLIEYQEVVSFEPLA